jgi:hypothetical protein
MDLLEEGAQVAREILNRRDPSGSLPLDQVFVRLVAVEAYSLGVRREAGRVAETAAARVAQLRAELEDSE